MSHLLSEPLRHDYLRSLAADGRMDRPEEVVERCEDHEDPCLFPKSDLTELRAEFERCWAWIWASLCEFGPTHNKEHVWLRLSSRRAFLWPGKSCAIVGEVVIWPIGLRDFNYWLQGGNLRECCTLHSGIEQWARMRGCHRATGYGREGWARVMHGAWEKGMTSRVKWLIGRNCVEA